MGLLALLLPAGLSGPAGSANPHNVVSNAEGEHGAAAELHHSALVCGSAVLPAEEEQLDVSVVRQLAEGLRRGHPLPGSAVRPHHEGGERGGRCYPGESEEEAQSHLQGSRLLLPQGGLSGGVREGIRQARTAINHRPLPLLPLRTHLHPLLPHGPIQVLPRSPRQAQCLRRPLPPLPHPPLPQLLPHPLCRPLHPQEELRDRRRLLRTYVQAGGAAE